MLYECDWVPIVVLSFERDAVQLSQGNISKIILDIFDVIYLITFAIIKTTCSFIKLWRCNTVMFDMLEWFSVNQPEHLGNIFVSEN